jgi:hypothetical protein
MVMDWSDHDRWAEKLGIDKQVSSEVNRIVDSIDQGESLPSEYRKHLKKCSQKWADEEGAAEGNSALGMVIEENTKRGHDQSRNSTTDGDIAAEVQRCAMRRMGDDYVKAWYLHHHLDYLHENRNSDKSAEELIDEYEEKHPHTYSQEVSDFLSEHKKELTEELGI